MGNCCRGQSSTPVVSGGDRRALPPKNLSQRRHGANSCSTTIKGSKEGNLRELKIRMTKKELKELVGWLNMADSSFEQVMARLVNVISEHNGDDSEEDDRNIGQMVKLRQQRSWRPSLQSIPEII
ncbi:uncharacterized protein LOC111803724 [Cucurbita pepo subsp. pepo]|uniref:uncharacterized protein LOC111803724 n=1 Tax=Cucurbita pepo subsp. pepo TaxID=3664 RepID=UPI000C9D6FC2|nr:uncharacterized protein LOC111803724 [Cucurbita pepo subsp. pepo]